MSRKFNDKNRGIKISIAGFLGKEVKGLYGLKSAYPAIAVKRAANDSRKIDIGKKRFNLRGFEE
jgi:hypothetical protein